MTDTNARLAALEAENHALRNRLSVLEAGQPKKSAPPPPDDGVKIFVALPVAHPRQLPDVAEAAALHKIVVARFPALKFHNASGELEFFRAAFAFICSLTKTAAPVTKYAPSWWVDYAQQWCRDANVPGVIRSLLPAVVATGDIQFTFDDRSAFWLDPYRASGRAVDAQKEAVLAM